MRWKDVLCRTEEARVDGGGAEGAGEADYAQWLVSALGGACDAAHAA